jgi:hypothetical protein
MSSFGKYQAQSDRRQPSFHSLGCHGNAPTHSSQPLK